MCVPATADVSLCSLNSSQSLLLTHFFQCREKKEAQTQADPRHRPGSSLLLPAAPTRGGNAPQTSTKTNHHILVEFGLQVREQLF